MIKQLHFAMMRYRNKACILPEHCQQEIIEQSSVCKSCSVTWSSENTAWTSKVTMRKRLERIGEEYQLRTFSLELLQHKHKVKCCFHSKSNVASRRQWKCRTVTLSLFDGRRQWIAEGDNMTVLPPSPLITGNAGGKIRVRTRWSTKKHVVNFE